MGIMSRNVILVDVRYLDSLNMRELYTRLNVDIQVLTNCELLSCKFRNLKHTNISRYTDWERKLTRSKENFSRFPQFCPCVDLINNSDSGFKYIIGDVDSLNMLENKNISFLDISALVKVNLNAVRNREDISIVLFLNNRKVLNNLEFENSIYVHDNITSQVISALSKNLESKNMLKVADVSKFTLFRSIANLCRQIFAAKVSKIFQSKWRVMLVSAEEDNIRLIKMISTSGKNFLADPFVTEWKGEKVLFAEKWNCERGMGEIVCFLESEFYEREHLVIQEDFHISYPCVFYFQGNHYIFPEMHKSGKQYVYQAKNFPLEWMKLKVDIYPSELVDPTIYIVNEEIKLLFNARNRQTATFNKSLKCVTSKQVLKFGEVDNFVLEVSKSLYDSRNGGQLFNGEYFRVAQRNGFNCYGKYFSVERIEFSNNGVSRKKILDSQDFELGKLAIHHVTNSSNLYALDVKSSKLNLYFRLSKIKELVNAIHNATSSVVHHEAESCR